jgi:hypothetical protein
MPVLWPREWQSDSVYLNQKVKWQCILISVFIIRDHLKNIKPEADSGFWVFGGAMLDNVPQEGSPLEIRGSVMLAVASSKEEVLEKIKKDVYAAEGVWDMDKVSQPSLIALHDTLLSYNYARFKYSHSSRLSDLLCEM